MSSSLRRLLFFAVFFAVVLQAQRIEKPVTPTSGTGNLTSAAGAITGLVGDATAAGPGVASIVFTNVNGAPGTYGNSTHCIVNLVTNAKGLITGISQSTSCPGSTSTPSNILTGALASRPSTCTPGTGVYLYDATDQAADQQLSICSLTNVWTVLAGLITPGSTVVGSIPLYSSNNGSSLGVGLGVVTTLGIPGVDTNVATEKAVRTAVAAVGVVNSASVANQFAYYPAIGSAVSGKFMTSGDVTTALGFTPLPTANPTFTGTLGGPVIATNGATPGVTAQGAGTGTPTGLPAMSAAGWIAPVSGSNTYFFKYPATVSTTGLLTAAAAATGVDGVLESTVSTTPLQGTDSKVMTSGTVTGGASTPTCMDSNGGLTTIGCSFPTAAAATSVLDTQSGATYSIPTGDCWGTIYRTSTSAMTDTLPTCPAGSIITLFNATTATVGDTVSCSGSMAVLGSSPGTSVYVYRGQWAYLVSSGSGNYSAILLDSDYYNQAAFVTPSGNTNFYGNLSFNARAAFANQLTLAVGTAISSTGTGITIAPTTPVVHVTGTGSIGTMTPNNYCNITNNGCQQTLIPDGLWTITSGTGSGQFKNATTAVVGKPIIATFDAGTGLWYSSY